MWVWNKNEVLKQSLKSPVNRRAFVLFLGAEGDGQGGEKASLSFLIASQLLQETSQIHTMFPSTTSCLWISKRSDRCVNSHRAKNCPGIIQLCTLKRASYSSMNSWTKKCHFNPPLASRCTFSWGHLGLISHCGGHTDPFFGLLKTQIQRGLFSSFYFPFSFFLLIEWVFNRRCEDEQIFLNAKCWWIHSTDTPVS